MLVAAFLNEVEDLSLREAADEAGGVTADDVRRWRADEWKWLTAKKRRALKRFLDRRRVRMVADNIGVEVREPGIDYDAEGFGSDFQDLLRSETLLFQQLRVWGEPGKRSDDKRSLIDLLVRVGEDLRREGHKLDLSHLSKAYAAILEGKL